jgi:hypothetical protein
MFYIPGQSPNVSDMTAVTVKNIEKDESFIW